MPRVAGIDVGGTTVKSGLLENGHFAAGGADRSTPHGAEAVMDLVCDIVHAMRATGRLDAVGVAVPGVVDDDAGTGVWSANLGWRDVTFKDELTHRLGVPVAFGHDVRCGGLAEACAGAGRNHANVVFMPIGTGIAAALILGGRTYDGQGWAGELGHVDVGHQERCPCGATGCLEAIASGAAMARRYTEHTGRPARGAAAIAELVRDGDAEAIRVWDEALEGLSLALAWMTSVLAPEVIVVGGGVSRAGNDLLLDPLRSRLEDRLSFQRRPRLVRAALGDRAGWCGAALIARDEAGGDR